MLADRGRDLTLELLDLLAYQEAERESRGRSDLDVVLLGADSLETIKRTHSSYFEPRPLDELLPA